MPKQEPCFSDLSAIYDGFYFNRDGHYTPKITENNGKAWQKIDSHVDFASDDSRYWCYIGVFDFKDKVYPETILFDRHSENMLRLKRNLLKRCAGKTIPDILTLVNEMVNELTDRVDMSRADVEKNLDQWLYSYHQRKKAENVLQSNGITIEMEELINLGLLICRHKAIIAATLIVELMNHRYLPPGQARMYRTHLMHNGKRIGCHAFSLYSTSDEHWLCDPRWENVAEINKNKDVVIAKGYGNQTVDKISTFLTIMNKMQQITRSIKEAFSSIKSLLDVTVIEKPALTLKFSFNANDLITTRAMEQALINHKVAYGLKFGLAKNVFSIDTASHSNITRLASISWSELARDFQTFHRKLSQASSPSPTPAPLLLRTPRPLPKTPSKAPAPKAPAPKAPAPKAPAPKAPAPKAPAPKAPAPKAILQSTYRPLPRTPDTPPAPKEMLKRNGNAKTRFV